MCALYPNNISTVNLLCCNNNNTLCQLHCWITNRLSCFCAMYIIFQTTLSFLCSVLYCVTGIIIVFLKHIKFTFLHLTYIAVLSSTGSVIKQVNIVKDVSALVRLTIRLIEIPKTAACHWGAIQPLVICVCTINVLQTNPDFGTWQRPARSAEIV